MLVCTRFFKDHLGTISEAHPWSRLILLSQQSLVFCSSLSRGEALWDFPHPHWHVIWCFHILFMQSWYKDITGVPVISLRFNHVSGFLVLQFLNVFCVLDVRVLLCMYHSDWLSQCCWYTTLSTKFPDY